VILALPAEKIDIFSRTIQYDPSRTLTLRNIFARNMRKRFIKLRGLIRRAIVDEDCFGLLPRRYQTLGNRAFDFPRSGDKVVAFMQWLRQMIDDGILEIVEIRQLGTAIEQAWTNLYVKDSYERGVIRARYELIKAGYPVPTLEMTGGIAASMSLPFHVDRLGLLFTRVFSDLRGITAAMDMQIGRVLAQGIADGLHPRQIATNLTRTISGPVGDLGITDILGRFIPAQRRAELLARTEIIRSYAEASLQEYKNWGVVGVKVKAEFRTAGDDRVCPICASMEGKVFTLDEASGKIPVHPQCRCIWLPLDVTG